MGKRLALGDFPHQCTEAEFFIGCFAHYLPYRRHIVVLHLAPERIGHQLLAEVLYEQLFARQHHLIEAIGAFKLIAIPEHTFGIDWHAIGIVAELADRIEILQRKTDGIHHVVAGRA